MLDLLGLCSGDGHARVTGRMLCSNSWTSRCTIVVENCCYTIIFSFDVLVEVQIPMQSSHNYFYYKYLQLCILILMFAHLRVMLGKESIFQFKVYGSVSYPRHYCNIYGHTKASTEHKRIDLDHSISIIIDIIVLPWIRNGREYG